MRKFWWIAPVVLLVDQLTKHAARGLTQPVVLIPRLVCLRYAENTGMAFSLFSGQSWLLGILSAVLLIAGALVLRGFRLGRWAWVSTMLILGGAGSNMLDRLVHGYVVDMIELLFIRFAVFNIADIALTVGFLLAAWSLFFRPEDWSEKNGNTKGNPV